MILLGANFGGIYPERLKGGIFIISVWKRIG
jgi:hypothetical protein